METTDLILKMTRKRAAVCKLSRFTWLFQSFYHAISPTFGRNFSHFTWRVSHESAILRVIFVILYLLVDFLDKRLWLNYSTFSPKNLQRGCKILYICRSQAALGNLKTSFHCARLHCLCRSQAALGNLKIGFHCMHLHRLCSQANKDNT